MPSSSANGRYARPIHSLVLDAGPLLTTPYGQIKSFNAIHYYTVPLAREEVRDETARATLESWGSELRVRQPLPKSIQEVTAFAKKTGDYAVLSLADIHILALTYELECELNHGDWRLLKEPGSKVRRGPQPSQRPQGFSTVSAVNDECDDEDTRSVITDVTTATITPSESASTIFHNPFNLLQPPSSSGSSTPRSTPISHRLSTFDDVSVAAESQLSTTSTAKATLNTQFAPSVVTTESLVSPRRTATNDWSAQSDDEDSPVQSSAQHSLESSLSSLEGSLQTLELYDDNGHEDDDGEGLWITPGNIKKHKVRDSTISNYIVSSTSGTIYPQSTPRRRSDPSEQTTKPVMKSACITGDYAVQNVALQMGLNLISMDGMSIRHVKTWILRCHGCFSITKKLDLKFCPVCGGDTLLRTSTSTNANGEVKIHLKKNMQWTNRGTKFSLPKPQGMTATPSLSTPPPILRADQKEFIHAKETQRRREKDLMDPDNLPTFLEGSKKNEGFGFGGRSSGRIGGGRGRGTNAVRRR